MPWDRTALKARLESLGFSHRRDRGQNFLTDRWILEGIADVLPITSSDVVFEIGAGPGGLTEVLAERAGSVVSVEIEPVLADLAVELAGDEIVMVGGDVLYEGAITPTARAMVEMEVEDHSGGALYAIGNLPYRISPAVIRALVWSGLPVAGMAFLVQEEVADRMAASAGSDGYGPLSVHCQVWGRVERHQKVPANAFFPQPQVGSRVVTITADPEFSGEPVLADTIDGLFQQRRKTLRNVLRELSVEDLAPFDDVAEKRAESLSPGEILAIARRIAGA
jgi:16S rRNA (adenine1518-N6/adenine1519-N6)-dimethyltransferase